MTKVFGCFTGAAMGRFRIGEAWIVGLGMISRGEVALVIATIGLQTRVIDGTVFSVAVVMTVVTTLITPLLLRLALGKRSTTDSPALPAQRAR